MSAPYTWFRDLLEFHINGGQHIGNTPTVPPEHIKDLRLRLIKEEVIEETIPALETNNLEKIADGIADSIIVLIGTAVAYGIDLEMIWNEVHKTNLEKLKGDISKDAGGKIQKPPGWKPPQIKQILETQPPLNKTYLELAYPSKTSNWTPCSVEGCIGRAEAFIPNKALGAYSREYAPYCREHLRS